MDQDPLDLPSLISNLMSTGRLPTSLELASIRQYASRPGFDSTAITRAGGRLSGLSWHGRVLTGSDPLGVAEAHYLRYVVVGREWPTGTSMSEYVSSLVNAILDEFGPVLLDIKLGVPRLSFFSQTNPDQRQRENDWILVGFDVHYGYWTTGFRTLIDPEAYRQQLPSALRRWLHPPT